MSNLKLKVDELLAKLEKNASAEEIFANNLSKEAEATFENNQSSADNSSVDPEMIKIAEEWDQKGRILARAFFDEFQKLAYLYETGQELPEENIVPVDEEAAVNILTKIYNNLNNQ